jgi:predicted MFS family arabinose efflux permease
LVALSVAVFNHTHNALAVAAFLFAWEALPAFVVPAVVARVEASRRRGELSALYFFEALVTTVFALLLWHFSLAPLLFLAVLDGTAALTANSLLRAEVARAASEEVAHEVQGALAYDQPPDDDSPPAERLTHNAKQAERKANAALNIATSTSFVLGPAFGGVIVAAAGPSAALFIDVASFLVCGALLIDLHPHVEQVGSDSIRARLGAAWRHITEQSPLLELLLVEAAVLIFFEAGGPIEVVYAKATLHAGDRGFGLLLAMWGIGGVLGSLLFARFVRKPLGGMLTIGAFIVGAAYLGLAVAPTLALACVAAAVGGVGNSMQFPSLVSVVQWLTPQRLHGRLMGAVESVGSLSVAIGYPLGGALVALSTTRVAFLVIGVGALLTTAALLRLWLTRSLEPPGGEPAADAPAV